jgi:hypothetical protein
LREYLIYWGFTPSPIPPKHSNPRVSKLGLNGYTNTLTVSTLSCTDVEIGSKV